MSYEEYRKFKDEQIVALIQNDTNSEHKYAMEYILEKYKYVVRQKAKALFIIGGERDDLIQEGMIGLYKAIRDYKQDKETRFFTFADHCISRQIYTAIKTSNRKKNIPLNTYISFYAPVTEAENEQGKSLLIVDLMMDESHSNPEKLVIDKESVSMLEYELERRLSSLEREVIRLHITGMKYTEIAVLLNKEPKAIDNALQRSKAKLNGIMKDISSR